MTLALPAQICLWFAFEFARESHMQSLQSWRDEEKANIYFQDSLSSYTVGSDSGYMKYYIRQIQQLKSL